MGNMVKMAYLYGLGPKIRPPRVYQRRYYIQEGTVQNLQERSDACLLNVSVFDEETLTLNKDQSKESRLFLLLYIVSTLVHLRWTYFEPKRLNFHRKHDKNCIFIWFWVENTSTQGGRTQILYIRVYVRPPWVDEFPAKKTEFPQETWSKWHIYMVQGRKYVHLGCTNVDTIYRKEQSRIFRSEATPVC